MPRIDRDSVSHAKQAIEKMLPDEAQRESVIDFIVTAIEYANRLNAKNWNLNLDKNGQFVRFNVGHEYCIEIDKSFMLILCNRITLSDEIESVSLPAIYRGHSNRQRVESRNIDEVPDCLAKTPNSVGCVISNRIVTDFLSFLEPFNHQFIRDAIQTKQLPTMREAHSKGCIDYFSEVLNRPISNPNNIISEADFRSRQLQNIVKAKTLTTEKLKCKIEKKNGKSTKICVTTIRYSRNPFLSEYIKRLANGTCQDCQQPAPFLSKDFNEPFLETHHIIPLSEGGLDTFENLIALCPNCHRKRHYG